MSTYTIEVGAARSRVVEKLPRVVHKAVDKVTSYPVKGAWHMGLHPGIDRVCLFTKGRQSFPSGLLTRILEVFEEYGCKANVKDRRETAVISDVQVLERLKALPIQLRYYQVDGVIAGVANPYGLFWWPTGSGKTTLISALILCYDLPTLVLTHRKELMYQLQRGISGMTGEEVGIIGDGHWKPAKWTVGIVSSLIRKDELLAERAERFLGNIRYLMCDEVHHLAATTWVKIAKACAQTQARHGFSGTCFRTDNADLHLLAHTGDVISHFTTTYMIEQGWLSRPLIYMPQMDSLDRVKSDHWGTVERVLVTENSLRNTKGCSFIATQYEKGEQVLAMVRLVKHGRLIRQMLSRDYGVDNKDMRYMTGSEPTSAREKALEDFRVGNFPILIGTSIYNEGVDLPRVCAAINFAGGDSDIATTQRLGRVLRKIPPDGQSDVDPHVEQRVKYMDFFDTTHKWLRRHSRHRRSVYEGEKAFILKQEYESDDA